MALVTHDDHSREVACAACGHRFDPSQLLNDIPPMSPDLAGLAEPKPSKAPAIQELTLAPEPGQESFSQAEAVFQELRDFGESVVPNAPAPAKSPASAPPPAPAIAADPEPVPATTPAPHLEGIRMTSGPTLQGFQIEEYLAPVSLACPVDGSQEEPLKPAFDKLLEKVHSLGGNGVVDLKWVLSADSSRVVLSGVPVRCRKA